MAEKFQVKVPVESVSGKRPPSSCILTCLSQNEPVEGEGRERDKGERRLFAISSYKDTNLIRSGLRAHLIFISS